MNSKGFRQLFIVEWKLNMRNFINIFFAIVFPLMMLMLFGTMYGNEPSEFMGGFGGVDVSVPGYICMIIAVTGLMTLPITLATYRERKILKRFLVTPMKPMNLLLTQLIINLITTVIGLIILLIVGKVVFDLHYFGNIFEGIIVFALVVFSIFPIGLFIASISKNMKMANAIAYIIYFPMLFLSGATMPLEMMPKSIVNISKVLPLSHGVEVFKGVWLGGQLVDYLTEIVILLVIGIVLTIGSIVVFRWE